MKEIVTQKKWVYTLYKVDEGLLLSVVCGGVGMFNVDLLLSASEAEEIKKNPEYIDELAEKVRNSPQKYTS